MIKDKPAVHSARLKIAAVLLLAVTAATVPFAVAYGGGQGTRAVAKDASAGSATIIWGNPFLVPTVAYGNGWEKIGVTGKVGPGPDANGFYSFQNLTLGGSLHATWTNGTETYVLDTTFSGINDYDQSTHYYPVRVIPASNELEATGIEFTGGLTVNGQSTELYGIAAVTTAVPGYIGFTGTSPAIYVVFYVSTDFMITVSWSQQSQTFRGIYHPACSSLIHIVRLAETGWW